MNRAQLFSQVPRLADAHVVLHSIGDKDVDQLVRLYSDERTFRYCGILNKTNRDTVAKMVGHFHRDFVKQQRVKWGVFVPETDTLAGIIEVMDVAVTTDSVTLGYYLHPDDWNRGLTKAAVALVLGYLFREVEVNRVAAYVMPANQYSKRVLLANGFTREGLIREGHLWPGKGLVDLEVYGLLRREALGGEGCHTAASVVP